MRSRRSLARILRAAFLLKAMASIDSAGRFWLRTRWPILPVIFALSAQSDVSILGSPLASVRSYLGPSVVLAPAAALMTALSVFTVRWGADFAQALSTAARERYTVPGLEFFGAVLAYGVSNLFAVPLNLLAGLAFGESLQLGSGQAGDEGPVFWQMLWCGLLGGGIFHAGGAICLRKGNLIAGNPGINAVAYGTPLVGLAWLILFSQVAVARFDYLALGAGAIVAANVLISFESEIRWRLRVLTLALGACRAVVCLRGGFRILF